TADMTGGYGLLLDRGERPKLLKRCRPGAIRNTFPSPTPHRLTRGRIDDQLPDGAGQILGVMRFGDQSILVFGDQFFRATGIGDDDRKPGGLSFDDDIAERIGRAWENENVRGSV